MQIHPSLLQSFMHQNSNKKLEIGATDSEEKSAMNHVAQQTIRQSSAMKNQNYLLSPSETKRHQGTEFSDQITLSLLELELKWIQKQTQIKEYVESLKKTIEEKDLRIEKLQIENYKLSSKLTEIGKQKNSILDKLNQIHDAMFLFQSQKLKKQSETQFKESTQFTNQNILIKEILKLTRQTNEKDSQKMLSSNQSQSREVQRQQIDTQNMQKRILSNIIKLFEQNFAVYPSPSSESSSQKNDEYIFIKKDREIRVTAATTDTFRQKLQGSFTKKRQHSPIDSQNQKQSKEEKKKPETYKSARTITFSKDEEVDYHNEGENNRFYSYNVINSHQKISSQADSNELKENERFATKNQINQIQSIKIPMTIQKGSVSSSLKIQSKALNQSYECSQFQKQKRKRSKSKKKTTNLDYSLSSSLVSDNEVNNFDSRKLDHENESIFRPLTHENNSNPKQQIHLSNLSVSSKNLKKTQEPLFENSKVFEYNKKSNSDKISIQNSRNSEIYQQSGVSSSEKYDKNAQEDKQLEGKNLINSKCKPSNPELFLSLKHPNLTKFCAYTFQNSPKNEPLSLPVNHTSLQSASKKNFSIERQNSITFENTNQKRSRFDSNDLDLKQTEAKYRNQINDEEISNKKTRLFVQEVAPETKCSSFQEKSCGNSFYYDQLSSSNDPFKKLRLQSESSEREHQNNSNRFMFENQMLKSYNKVLEKQAKKMSQTQKLMQKFSSQNISILNKMHKKSIY